MLMREIKFRLIRGGQIVGYERLNKWEWEWMCPAINPDKGERWNFGVMTTSYMPDDCNREQFTGLRDQNGKEIYEGDIIRLSIDEKPTIVGWSEKFASFVLSRDGWAFQHWFGESCSPERTKVIGNIHQNPELL